MVLCSSRLRAPLAAAQRMGQNALQRVEGKAGSLLSVEARLKNNTARDMVLVKLSEWKFYPWVVHLLSSIKMH